MMLQRTRLRLAIQRLHVSIDAAQEALQSGHSISKFSSSVPLNDLLPAHDSPASEKTGKADQPANESHLDAWQTLQRQIYHAKERKDFAGTVRLLDRHRALGSPLSYDADTGFLLQRNLNGMVLLARSNSSPGDAIAILRFLLDMGRSPGRNALQETLTLSVRLNRLDYVNEIVDIVKASQERDPHRQPLPETVWLSVLRFGQKRRQMPLIVTAWENIKGSSNSPQDPSQQAKHAYVDALAACKRFREAFELIGATCKQHPSTRYADWYGGLTKLIDYMAEDKTDLQGVVETALDILHEGGDLASVVPQSLVAAYGQRGNMTQAFKTFDLFYEELKLRPSPDAYAAVLTACLENNLLDSVPLILEEMAAKEILPSPKLLESVLRFYIVTNDKEMVTETMEYANAQGFRFDRNIYQQGLKRQGVPVTSGIQANG